MPRCTPEYLRERGRAACTAGGHVEALRDAADEIERLRKFIESLDGKHICSRSSDGFIDEAVIVAADILEV